MYLLNGLERTSKTKSTSSERSSLVIGRFLQLVSFLLGTDDESNTQ
jgi:hypothetical protein